MKKIALLFLALCVFIISCQKYVKVPVSYTVETTQGTPLTQFYVPDLGTYDLGAWVKFLSGTNEDKVTLVIKGLPADVIPEKDTISGHPSFTADFMLHTNHAVRGTYPVSILAYAKGSEPKTYYFNITIIPADCASLLWGDYTGANSCTGRSYPYAATASATGIANTLTISNFGGYGTNTNTQVFLDCNTDSLTIPSQTIGNGTTLSGKGVFTGGKMTIWYSASNTPGGFPETCTAILTK